MFFLVLNKLISGICVVLNKREAFLLSVICLFQVFILNLMNLFQALEFKNYLIYFNLYKKYIFKKKCKLNDKKIIEKINNSIN